MADRVILDFLAASTGGHVTRARAFLTRLRTYDSQSEFWAIEENDTLEMLLKGSGVHPVNVIVKPGLLKPLRRMAWQSVRLTRLARDLNATTYVTFSHHLPWALPKNVRKIIGVSNLAPFSRDAMEAESQLTGRLRLRLLRRTIISSARRADAVVALSYACRDVLIAAGVESERIHVIPNGVESHEGAPTSGAAPSISGEFVLYVSHFYPYKNHIRLIQAYAMLSPALRERYALVLVGAPYDQTYYRAVIAAVAELGLSQRVEIVQGLTGPPLAELFHNAAVFAFPSLVENCPNSLLEAMGYGLPVIAGAHAPMPEFGGDAARYFDAHSTAAIAEALADVLTDDSNRGAMAERSRRQGERFSWDAFTEDVVSLYRGPLLPPTMHSQREQ